MAKFLETKQTIDNSVKKKKKKQQTQVQPKTQPKKQSQPSQQVQQTTQRFTQKYGGGSSSGGSSRGRSSGTRQRTSQPSQQTLSTNERLKQKYGVGQTRSTSTPTSRYRSQNSRTESRLSQKSQSTVDRLSQKYGTNNTQQREEPEKRYRTKFSAKQQESLNRLDEKYKTGRVTGGKHSFMDNAADYSKNLVKAAGQGLELAGREDLALANRFSNPSSANKFYNRELNATDYEKNKQRMALRQEGLRQKIKQQQQEMSDLAEGQNSKLGRLGVEAAQSAGGMLADTMAGPFSLVHMGARVTEGAQGDVIDKVEPMKKKMLASGNYTPEEVDEMFKDVEKWDFANAIMQGTIEGLTEKMFGGIGLAKKVGGAGVLDKVAGRIAGSKLTSNMFGKVLAGTAEEIAEEEIGNPAQAFASNLIYGNKLQAANEDMTRRELQSQSDDIRSQVQSEDDARRIAENLSSDDFMEESIKSYMESGSSKKEATHLAELSRDYLTASLEGDTERMKELQDEMVDIIAGGENSMKEKWTLQDALDVGISTAMMTVATGVPGAMTTSAMGTAYKDANGMDRVRNLAQTALNLNTEESAKAQAIIDSIDNGDELTGTQIYDVMSWAQSAAVEAKEREQVKDDLAEKRMNEEDLMVMPSVVTENGYQLSEATEERFETIAEQTLAKIDELDIDAYKDGGMDAYEIADTVAAYETGTITAEQMNALNIENPENRSVFEEMTGIDLSKYNVTDRSGRINEAASNVAMQTALFAKAADNYVESARIEQENWNNTERGAMAETLSKRIGGQGDKAVYQAMMDVDPRDRSKFELMGRASETVYRFAYNTEGTWDEAEKEFSRRYPSLSNASLKAVFEAAKDDKATANTKYYGEAVKAGEALSKKSMDSAEQVSVAGKFTNDTDVTLKADDQVFLQDMASTFNVNIEAVESMPIRVTDRNGNVVERQANGQFNRDTNTLVINLNADVTMPLRAIVSHELTHSNAYAPDEMLKLLNYIRDSWYRNDPEGYTNAINERKSRYSAEQNLSDLDALEEIVADGAQDFDFWNDSDLAERIATEEPTLAAKIINTIKDILRRIRSMLMSDNITNEDYRNALFAHAVDMNEAERLWLNAAKIAVSNKANQDIEAMHESLIEESNNAKLSIGDELSDTDAEYMDAVERGDMETAQRLVDKAAEEAMPNTKLDGKWYHGTYNDFTVFDFSQGGKNGHAEGYGIYLSNSQDITKEYGTRQIQSYVNMVRPASALDSATLTKRELHSLIKITVEQEAQQMAEDYGDDLEAAKLDTWISNYTDTHMARSLDAAIDDVIKSMLRFNGNDMDIVQEIMTGMGIRDYETASKFYDILTETTGIDGFTTKWGDEDEMNDPNTPTIAVAFRSSQIKDASPVTYDDEGNVIPLSERFNADNADIRYSVDMATEDALEAEGVTITESGSAVRFSYDSWINTDKDELLNNLLKAGYDRNSAEKWIADVNSVASVILSDMGRLNYEADQFQDALKPNAEYYYTLDLSTLCQKRRLYQGTYNKIMHHLVNSVLMPEDTIRLRQMMDEMGHQVPCGICYEESRKKNEGKFAQRWLNGYGKRWKGYKNQEHTDPYIPTLDEVTTTDGREKLRAEHPEAYESYVQYQKTRGSANPKISYTHTDYRGDILRMTDSEIEKVMHIGGLRIQSFSDFEVPHVIDMMQAVLDMSSRNLTAQAYTKVPAFADIFGGTGIKINLSLIGRLNPETGVLEFDSKEGIDPDEAFRIREKYSHNVGTILVGADDASILAAWADPRVDMVIPFHRSGWGKKEFEKLGLTGDQKLQGIYAEDYWDYSKTGKENAEAYLALCAEKHYRPVFYQFLHDNGDGTWSLQEDGSTDGYWKSLVDFKMYDNDGVGAKQELVQPNFDMDAAKRILDEYEGGADTLPVADDVVTEFLKEYKQNHPNAQYKIENDSDVKYSIAMDLDEPYMSAVNSGNMEEAQRLIDEAANRAGFRPVHRYHGSMNANFTVFDKAYAKVGGNSGAGFYFSTSRDDSENHYQDVEGADNYFKWSELAEQINDAVSEGTWKGYPELGIEADDIETYEDAVEAAKKILNKSPGTFDVYLNYKNPYIRDYKNSTNIYDMLMDDFDESVIDRDDYEDEWEYEDAVWEAKAEHLADSLYSAVYGAYQDIEDNYEVIDMPYIDEVLSKITEYAFDGSLTWEEIQNGIVFAGEVEVTNPNWTDSGDATAEFARAIIENLGFDAIEDREVSSKFGQLSREMQTDTEHIIVFQPEQIKLSDPVTYAEDGSVIPLSERFDPTSNDIRYSMPTQDADGNILTDGQMEYFKNSQARDEQGRLVPMYHGTENAGFTIFDSDYGNSSRFFFFADSIDRAKGYSGTHDIFNAKNYETVDEANEYIKSWGNEDKVVQDGDDFIILEDGDEILRNSSLSDLMMEYDEYSGFGGTSSNYKVYLNVENPLVIDAGGNSWDAIPYDDDIVTTNWLAEYAYEEGYDGLIVDNVLDYGLYSSARERMPQRDIVVFSSSQIKDTRNENPTDDPDIRYSFPPETEDEINSRKDYDHASSDDFEILNAYEQMIEDGAAQAEFMNLSDEHLNTAYFMGMMERYGKADKRARKTGKAPKVTSVLSRYETEAEKMDAFYRSLMEETSMVYDDEYMEEGRRRMAKSKEDFYSNLNAKWDDRWLSGGVVLNVDSVKGNVRELVKATMANSSADAQYRIDTVNKTLFDMRTAYMFMKQGRQDIASAILYQSAQRMIGDLEFVADDTEYKNYKELRRYLRNTRIEFTDQYWEDIDWSAYRKKNRGRLKLIKGNKNSIDDGTYDELVRQWPEYFSDAEMEKNGYKHDVPGMMQQLDYVLDLNVQPVMEAYSSEAAADLAFSIADDLYTIMENGDRVTSIADRYKEKYDAKTKALKVRHAEALLRMREMRDKGIAEANRRFREYKAQQKESRYHSKYFDSITKSYDKLTERLLTNTKDKHIPEMYKKDLAQLLSAFDLQTVGSKKFEARTGRRSQKTIKMDAIKTVLTNIGARDQLFHVNDSITDIIDRLLGKNDYGEIRPANSIEGKTIDELPAEALKDIDQLLKALIHEFNTYESVRVGAKRQQAADIGTTQIGWCLDHADKFGKGKDYQNVLGGLDKLINLDEVTPAYMFRMIDPNNEGIGLMYKELRRSFGKYVNNQKQLNEWMNEIIGEYHNKGKILGKYGANQIEAWRRANSAIEFEFGTPENPQKVELTPAQMMSIYCLAKRQQALQHMQQGGIVVMPVSFQARMVSDLKKNANYSLPVKLTDANIKTIVSRLTPEQKSVADKLQNLMATKMADWGNEASMNVIGIKLFEDPNYFPIKSDKAAMEKDFTEEQFAQMIRNFGFTKAVMPNANNSIAINDIFDVVAEHCNNMNLYNAYSETMNDFMKVYNYKEYHDDGSHYTVEQAIAHAYSRKATTFISSFMKDLNGNVSKGRVTGIDAMMNAALGNAKKASVFANGRVALQQPTALARAFYVIKPKYLKGVKYSKDLMQEMFDHSPIALWKSWGYYDINMGKSIEDLMMNEGSVVEDWMSDIYGKLDNLTWTHIWGMCKNETKDLHPEVEEGSDEFWEMVSERMDEVVDLTQVVDSPFHRSHAMRDKQILIKMATSFMAEPTLTFNMVRDGILRAKEQLMAGNKREAAHTMSHTLTVFALSAFATSAFAAIWDVVRGKGLPEDDDDKDKDLLSKMQGFYQAWVTNTMENFGDNANILGNIYYVKDIVSLFQGWDQKNLGLQGMKHLADAFRQMKGEDVHSKLTWYENALAGIGYLSGLPLKTIMNDGKTLFKMFGFDIPEPLQASIDWLDRIGKDAKSDTVKDINKGETSTTGVSSNASTDKPVETRLWTYDNAPFHVEDGSLADTFLNHFGINLTKSEIAAAEAAAEKAKREEEIQQITKGLEKYSGEDYDKHLWDKKALEGYSKALEDGDFAKAKEIEDLFLECGGSQSFIDEKKLYHYKKNYLKTITYDPSDVEIENQQRMKEFLLSHGMTESELSEKVYKSQTAKELKVAFLLNDEDAMVEELIPLVRAGLSEADYEKLWKNRKRVDLVKYKESGGKYSERLKSTGKYIWPVSGRIASESEINSYFGHRSSPGGVGSTNHQGIDLDGSMGDPVGAADGGTVVYAGWYGGAGKTVKIQHDDGTITQYSHLSWWGVKEGDVVGQGQTIGNVGSTGNSTGPHLHFGVIKNDTYVDPYEYLFS